MARPYHYVLPLVNISGIERWRLLAAHDRMEGAMAYVNAHPMTAFRQQAHSACDNYFRAIEALIPQEDA
jgi:hypothetical protein